MWTLILNEFRVPSPYRYKVLGVFLSFSRFNLLFSLIVSFGFFFCSFLPLSLFPESPISISPDLIVFYILSLKNITKHTNWSTSAEQLAPGAHDTLRGIHFKPTSNQQIERLLVPAQASHAGYAFLSLIHRKHIQFSKLKHKVRLNIY